jgi:hypothetical protein
MQIEQFARFAQNYAVRVSDFVRTDSMVPARANATLARQDRDRRRECELDWPKGDMA